MKQGKKAVALRQRQAVNTAWKLAFYKPYLEDEDTIGSGSRAGVK